MAGPGDDRAALRARLAAITARYAMPEACLEELLDALEPGPADERTWAASVLASAWAAPGAPAPPRPGGG